MAGDVAALLVSIAAGLTAIDQISIIITTKRLWKQQQQLQQQLEIAYLGNNKIKIYNNGGITRLYAR